MATIDDLRRATDEPAGESEYNDDELEVILAAANGNFNAAAAAVWREKAAKAAGLVDLTEGASSRKLSDLSANALRMARMYQDQADSDQPSGRRPTTVGRITRA
jgi:hypothetical protein